MNKYQETATQPLGKSMLSEKVNSGDSISGFAELLSNRSVTLREDVNEIKRHLHRLKNTNYPTEACESEIPPKDYANDILSSFIRHIVLFRRHQK